MKFELDCSLAANPDLSTSSASSVANRVDPDQTAPEGAV